VLDCGTQCFVWIGSGASKEEKKNGIIYATVSLINREAFNYHYFLDAKCRPRVLIKDE
jgi:hypothetical protein